MEFNFGSSRNGKPCWYVTNISKGGTLKKLGTIELIGASFVFLKHYGIFITVDERIQIEKKIAKLNDVDKKK